MVNKRQAKKNANKIARTAASATPSTHPHPLIENKPIDPPKSFPTLREKISAQSREKLDKCDLPAVPAFADLDQQRAVEANESNAYALALIKCTPKEIAALLNCSVEHVTKKFDSAIKLGNQVSNALLKNAMTKKALSGDTTMMVWLSKQHLGYREPKADEQEKTTINIVTSDAASIVNEKIIEVSE